MNSIKLNSIKLIVHSERSIRYVCVFIIVIIVNTIQ